MIRSIAIVFFVLLFAGLMLLGGVLAQMMTTDPGVVLIAWNGYSIEMTFWVGAGILLFLFVALPVLILVLRRFGPHRLWRRYRSHRDRKMARQETLAAINSWLAGDDERALTALARVAQAGGSERLPQAVSLALGMSHGDWLDRYAAFTHHDAELKIFAQSLLAERYWQNQQQDEFIQLLDSQFPLQQIVWLRERYWQALFTRNEHLRLIKLITEAPKLSPDARQQWLFKAVTAALAVADAQQGAQVLKVLDRAQRKLPEVAAVEIQHLMRAGKPEPAFKRLKAMLSAGELAQVTLLLEVPVENQDKLDFLESLQPSKPAADYCRVAGVLNLRQQLWGNAQSWLEKGWQLGDRDCGLALAELFEQRKMPEQASKLYRQLAKGYL